MNPLYGIAMEWHAHCLMLRAVSHWRRGAGALAAQRRANAFALEHWRSQTLHGSWARWLRRLGRRRKETAALTHWSIQLKHKAFFRLRRRARDRRCARLRRSRAVGFWADRLAAKCVARWRDYAAKRVAERVVEVAMMSAPESAKRSSSSSSAALLLPPAVPRTPIRSAARSPNSYRRGSFLQHASPKATRSSRAVSTPRRSSSSSSFSGISRRSFTAYRHAASKLLSRSMRRWRMFTADSLAEAAGVLAAADANRAAVCHHRATIMRVCFTGLHAHALCERRVQQCERLARRNNYFRLQRSAFHGWMRALAARRHRVCLFIQTRRPHFQLSHAFKQWEIYTRPRVCASNKQAARAQNVLRLQMCGLRALRAFASSRIRHKARLCMAVAHRETLVKSRIFGALQRAVLRADVAYACASEMRATRVRVCLRQTFDQWDTWTTNTVDAQEADALAKKHYHFCLASTYFARWADWTEERTTAAKQFKLAHAHWKSVTLGIMFDTWARVWQLAQNARDMWLSVARAHWRLQVVKRCFRGWCNCRILGPIGRRMHERRLIRRVARYAEHWRKVATKRSVWRMCHEGYPGHESGNRAASARGKAAAATPARSKPRCDPDLLRLSLSSLDGTQSMAETVNALSVEAAADLVASFATPSPSIKVAVGQNTPSTAFTQRRLPLLFREQQQRKLPMTPLTKTSDFIASLTSVQEKLLALGGAARNPGSPPTRVGQNIEETMPALASGLSLLVQGGGQNGEGMNVGKSSRQARDLLAHIRDLRRAVEGTLASP